MDSIDIGVGVELQHLPTMKRGMQLEGFGGRPTSLKIEPTDNTIESSRRINCNAISKRNVGP